MVEDLVAESPGAAADGVIEGGYLDALKLTAHSCLAFADTYRMTLTAMARLYLDGLSGCGELPMRMRQRLDESVARVIASVAYLIAGAANKGWIQGLGWQSQLARPAAILCADEGRVAQPSQPMAGADLSLWMWQ